MTDFIKFTDEQLQQVKWKILTPLKKYQLEVELIGGRDTIRSFTQTKMNNFVTKDKYKAALEQIKAADGAKVYQVLGKAYLFRKNDELAKDYEHLIE